MASTPPKAAVWMVACALSAAPALAAAACGSFSDFLARSDSLLAPVQPADCAVVEETPPIFTWPPQNGSNTYTVAVTFPDGRSESRSTHANFLPWDKALAPGDYTWSVKVAGSASHASEERRFRIAAGAAEFTIPSPEEILRRARAAPRPRTWSHEDGGPIAAVRSERAPGLRALLASVESERTKMQAEPAAKSKGTGYDETVVETKRALNAAFAWAATRERAYGAEGARRLLHLAAWNPMGSVGFASNDMASRTIAWTLALGYDWMHDYLDPAQKETIARAVAAHTQVMFAQVVPRTSVYPFDSHGNVSLTITAAIGLLMAGDVPAADRWVKEAVPMAVAWTSPWGGADGGYGNGTAQMHWDLGSNLAAWYVMRNAAGIDLSRKAWTRNLSRFMAYFVPPGTPAGNFGDGHELHLPELWARLAKAHASFAPTPLGLWYAGRLRGEDPGRLELLLAPRAPREPAVFPEGTPNAVHFPSVGWAAMHSDLADPGRTSVYFKSSAYGSYNHSHADQNSFVVNHLGKRLAIASGHYDGYRTPHWTRWYKQTRAANAITFDGGQGQKVDDKGAGGEITAFETGATHDYVVGRAEKAYGGALSEARRALLYLRPGVLIVHDTLASAVPRRWEWNIHALERMNKLSDRRIEIAHEGARMCVEMLEGPPVTFGQADPFAAPPSGRNMASQWHGTFATTSRTPRAEFIALLRIGSECPAAGASGVSATARRVEAGWRIEVDGRTVTLGRERARVN